MIAGYRDGGREVAREGEGRSEGDARKICSNLLKSAPGLCPRVSRLADAPAPFHKDRHLLSHAFSELVRVGVCCNNCPDSNGFCPCQLHLFPVSNGKMQPACPQNAADKPSNRCVAPLPLLTWKAVINALICFLCASSWLLYIAETTCAGQSQRQTNVRRASNRPTRRNETREPAPPACQEDTELGTWSKRGTSSGCEKSSSFSSSDDIVQEVFCFT